MLSAGYTAAARFKQLLKHCQIAEIAESPTESISNPDISRPSRRAGIVQILPDLPRRSEDCITNLVSGLESGIAQVIGRGLPHACQVSKLVELVGLIVCEDVVAVQKFIECPVIYVSVFV